MDIGAEIDEEYGHRWLLVGPTDGTRTQGRDCPAAAELMCDQDMLVLCADQPQKLIRHWTNGAALQTGTPWMLAHYAGPMAVVGFFVPGQTCCQACLVSMTDAIRTQYGWEPEDLFPFDGHAVWPGSYLARSAGISCGRCVRIRSPQGIRSTVSRSSMSARGSVLVMMVNSTASN